MADDEFNANKFAAEVLVQAAERTVRAVAGPLRNGVRRSIQIVTDAYRPFLFKTYKKVGTIRTFLRPTESVDLLDHYVPVDLKTKVSELTVDELIDGLTSGLRYVISALAGSGKSVLMRYIALSFFHAPRGRIPLFFELRSLNANHQSSLLEAIHEYYRGNSTIQFDDFVSALRGGYFVLILDGFDEISPSHRNSIESQIIRLAEDFDEVPIVVSGRHDERFNSWEPFSHFSLKSMTFGQTRELIAKSNYDTQVKEVFLDRLTDDFFETHQSFLENPLLAIMMMLTFEGYAEIPDSLHEFYRIAFDTLIRRHDALKGQFLRESHSGCSTEQFKQIFSSFSLLTYSKSAFSFDRDRALAFLNAAIVQQGLDKSGALVLNDLIESICLLQEEGFEISFVHRSFQEYFCALFVASSASGFVRRFLEEGELRTFDSVLPMLMGIAQQRVESEWANDRVAELCDQFPAGDPDSELRFFIAAYPGFEFRAMSIGAALMDIRRSKLARDISILRMLYPEVFDNFEGSTDDEFEFEMTEWEQRLSSVLLEMESAGDMQLKGFEAAVADAMHKPPRNTISQKFSIECDNSCGKLFRAIFGATFGTYVPFLHAVSAVQRERQARSNSFIGEVFGL